MKYAISNDQRIEATPKAVGKCPCCGADLIARCGDLKVWHWAHKGRRVCDHWWESETEWHRAWKDTFPKEWQEVVHFAEDGEKHIADIKTPDGFVIEFQHSYIKAEEKLAREQFYKNMVWVVDGKRAKSDYPRFEKNYDEGNWLHWPESRYRSIRDPDWTLPKAWLNRTVPVIFDWQVTVWPTIYTADGDLAPPRESDLLCLMPQTKRMEEDDYAAYAQCFMLKKDTFMKMITEHQHLKIPHR